MKDHVALITGGGEGIGEAAARELARAGMRVAVLGRTPDNTEGTVEKITEAGGEALSLQADISQSEEMETAIARIMETWGRLDAVFANAGINGVWAPIEELKPEEFAKTIAINLTGTFLTIKHAVPAIRKGARGGSIIITSSVNGNRMFSNTGASAYSASKAGQTALGKMLALEFGKDRIRVNVICPGAIESNIGDNTEQRDVEKAREPVEFPEGEIPLTRGEPGDQYEVARLVRFLASDDARHISGTEIYIDGAQSLLQG